MIMLTILDKLLTMGDVMKTCKCGAERVEGKTRCLGCQKEYMRAYMEKKRKGAGIESEVDLTPIVVKPSIVKEKVSIEDRNTIRDPNPSWNDEKILTSYNRQMECHICGKLSLTHGKMCFAEAKTYRYDDCYQTK